MENTGEYKIGQRIIDEIIRKGLVSAHCEGVSIWEKESAQVLSTFVSDDAKALLNMALRAICLTRDYVGEELLPPIKGWEWFDIGNEISNAVPDCEWAKEFRLRVEQSNENHEAEEPKEKR